MAWLTLVPEGVEVLGVDGDVVVVDYARGAILEPDQLAAGYELRQVVCSHPLFKHGRGNVHSRWTEQMFQKRMHYIFLSLHA